MEREGTAAASGGQEPSPRRAGHRAVVVGASVVAVLALVAVLLTDRSPGPAASPPERAGPEETSQGSMPGRGGAGAGALGPVTPAAAFTGSVGVNVHWDFLDTPYGSRYEEVRDALVASGIRHVRGADTSRAPDLARRGVATTVLVDQGPDGRGDPARTVERLAPLAATGAVDAVEGPNEGDVFWTEHGLTHRGQPFPAGVLAWQRDLWRAVRADDRTRHLTVIGPSLGGTYWGGGNPFAPGSLAGVADWANIHPYAAGNPYADRFSYGGIDDYYDSADFPSVALDRYPITLETYRPPFGDAPVAATEAGWSTWRLGPSEPTQAAYLSRLFLECYRLGLARCYSYELVDEFPDPAGDDREAHFGILRHDLSPKPAYTAVQALMAAVGDDTADPGGDPAATADDRAAGATLAGARLTVAPPAGYDAETVHHVVLVRHDGTAVVVLWQEVSRDDIGGDDEEPPQPVREVDQPAVDVSLDLGARAAGARVQVIAPDGRLEDAGARRSGTRWSFAVPDRVTLVTVPPR